MLTCSLFEVWDARVLGGPTGLPSTDKSLTIKAAQPFDQPDVMSLNLVVSTKCSPFMEQFKSFIRILNQSSPFSLTSCFRPTGTHRFGALDVAPDFGSNASYAHNSGWDPRLYARKDLLHLIVDVISDLHLTHVLIEDNHLHLHDPANPGVPPSLLEQMQSASQNGSGVAAIQVSPRSRYKRSSQDEKDDEELSSFYWVPLTHDIINKLPGHAPRAL